LAQHANANHASPLFLSFGLAGSLIMQVVHRRARATGDACSEALIRRAARYMAEHYVTEIRIADLAGYCHLSVRSLHNLFHHHCGEPPLRALRRFRLRRLHRSIQERPWDPLRLHYDGCGLVGSSVDRNLFLAMYGITVKEHQACSRQKRPPSALAEVIPFAPLPRAELEMFLEAVG
jgi:AraC-like DNA-binding protein